MLRLLLAASALAAAAAPPALPRVSLFLPEGSGVAVRLAAPAVSTAAAAALGWSDVRFALGHGGSVWFGHDGTHAANFTKGYRVRLERPFDDLAGLSGGGLVFASDGELAFAVPGASAGLAALQPIAALPVEEARLFAGDAGTLYIAGRGKDPDRRWELWVLEPEAARSELPTLRKVLSTTERVAAAAGDGRTTYVALGRLLGLIDAPGAALQGVFLHPAEDIASLAYSTEAGLFYATASGAGAVGPEGAVDFLRAPGARLVARGPDLYVFLPGSLTVLRLESAGKLREYAKTP